MLKKGSFPILKFTHNDISKQFEVNKPILKVGREKKQMIYVYQIIIYLETTLQLILKMGSISIVDNNSTNGILVNGRKLKESVLKQCRYYKYC